MSDCVWSETERLFFTICFQLCCSVQYNIKGAPGKHEGLDINASKGFVGVDLIYNDHRIVLEVRVA
jgi:hypothetical protein